MHLEKACSFAISFRSTTSKCARKQAVNTTLRWLDEIKVWQQSTASASGVACVAGPRVADGPHAAQKCIAELEAELQLYREKSGRAEDWLRKISAKIEDRLINEPEEQRRQSSWRPYA